MGDLVKRAKEAMDCMTRGKPVQFSPMYCEEAKGSKCTEWDTSHDLSVIRVDGSRYRIGTFRHAHDALFDQLARDLVPEMIDHIEALDAALLAADELARAVDHEMDARNLFLSTAPDRGGLQGPKAGRKAALEAAQARTSAALAAYRRATGSET